MRWNNHLHNIATTINELLVNEIFTDVTLAVESGWNIKCHKMVLAACSLYFQNLFNDLSCAHPIVVLQNVKEEEIKAILSYMYNGEVSVAQDQLPSLLKVAENLKVYTYRLFVLLLFLTFNKTFVKIIICLCFQRLRDWCKNR